jgi:hypothetical protein
MKLRYLALALLSGTMFGQAVRFDSSVTQPATNVPAGSSAALYTVPNAIVTVCGYPAAGIPCSNTVPIYLDQLESTQLAQPIAADAMGRFGLWIPPGQYSYNVQTQSGRNVGSFPLSLTSPQGSPILLLGAWGSSTSYVLGQAIRYNNAIYTSLVNSNLNDIPSSNPSQWALAASAGSITTAPSLTQNIVQPMNTNLNIITSGSGSFYASNTNGIINTAVCGLSSIPTWCSGTDIGAWVNAAIAQLPGHTGQVLLPRNGSYNQSTTIVKPRGVIIDCQNSKITYTGSTIAMVIGDTDTVNDNTLGGVQNCWFSNLTSGANIGFWHGGGDPSGLLPSTAEAAQQYFINVRLMSFNRGLAIGTNAYLSSWLNSYIVANNYGVSGTPGETYTFVASQINGNMVCGIQENSGGLLRFFGGGIDYNGPNGGGPAVCGTDVWHESHGTHYEQFTGPIINASAGSFHNILLDGGELQYTVGRQSVLSVAVASNIATVVLDDSGGYFAGNSYTFGTLTNATFLSGQTVTLTTVVGNTLTFPLIHVNYASASDSGNIVPSATEASFITIAGTGGVRTKISNVNAISGHPVVFYIFNRSLTGNNNFVAVDSPKWKFDSCGTVTGPGTCSEPAGMTQEFNGDQIHSPVDIFSSINITGSTTRDTTISAGTRRSLTLGSNGSQNLVQLDGANNLFRPFSSSSSMALGNRFFPWASGTFGFVNSTTGYRFNETRGVTITVHAGTCTLGIQGGIITSTSGTC